MKRLVGLVTVIFLLAVVPVSAQQLTPRQLFDRCGSACEVSLLPQAVEREGGRGDFRTASAPTASASVGPSGTSLAILRTSGSIVSGSSIRAYLDIINDFPAPVWIVGRVARVTDGRLVYDQPFYLARDLSLTRYGAGYFPNLNAGAVIPVGEISLGNATDETILQVAIYDSRGGGAPLQVLFTTMWSRVRPTASARQAAMISSVEIVYGELLFLRGRFPGGRLVLEIGDPEWDSAVTELGISPGGTNSLFIWIPPGKTGGLLYPRGVDSESLWGIYILTEYGESISFPGILRVRGSRESTAVLPVQ